MRDLAVVFGVAALVGCGGGGHDKPDGGGGDGAGHGYTRVTDGPIYCLVSADCPDGEHCELGACKAGCTTDADCPGQTCGPRGRCVEAASADVDPTPETEKPAELSLAEPRAVLATGVVQATITLQSSRAASVDYRIQPRVAWLKVASQWGHFEGTSTTVTVDVDRATAGAGTHVGQVAVVSSIGSAVFEVSFSEGLTGRYVGTVDVTSPSAITKLHFGVDLKEDAGFVDAKVLSDRSPLFPLFSSQPTLGSGQWRNGRVTLSLAQLVPQNALQAAGVSGSDPSGNPFGRVVGREIELTLDAGGGGNLSGTYVERVYGVFPDAIELQGTVSLVRVGLQSGETIDVPSAQAVNMPPAPSVARPDVTATCSGVATSCTSSSTGTALKACADALRGTAYGLATYEGPGVETLYQQNLSTLSALCALQADGTACSPPVTPATCCYQKKEHECALAQAYLADQRGAAGATDLVLKLISDQETLHSFIGNDKMVATHHTRLTPDAATTEAGLAAQAAVDYRRAAAAFDAAHVLDYLGYVPSTNLENSAYRVLRLAARAAANEARATEQEILVRVRLSTGQAARDEARARLQVSTLMAYLQMAAVARLLDLRQGPALSAEVGAVAASTSRLGQLFDSLTAGLNPLGFAPQYVPFAAKDPTKVPTGNNFQLVALQADGPVTLAVQAEQAAIDAWRGYETNADSVEAQRVTTLGKLKEQLVTLCGGVGLEPDLTACAGGNIGVEMAGVEVERDAVDVARRRVEAQQEKILIEVERAARVKGVHETTIAFLDEQGQEMGALVMMNAEISAAVKFFEIASNANLWNGGMALVDAAFAAGLELARGEIDKQKSQLEYMQKIRYEAAAEEIEYINSMALVKNMLVDTVTMTMEVGLETLKLLQAGARVRALQQQRDAVKAEYDATDAMINKSFANDPSWRLLRDAKTLLAIDTFETAMSKVYLAARALEYETNQDYPLIEQKLFGIRTAGELQTFLQCLRTSWDEFGMAYTGTQSYTQQVSLRDDVLRLTHDITDPVTGQTYSPAEQFRRMLLSPVYLDDRGGTGFQFSTSNAPDNGVFSTLVCNDRIVAVRAKLVGDFLGDNQVQLEIQQHGASLVRSCDANQGANDDIVNEYKLDPVVAQLQAGVNDWGTTEGNTTLASRSVAAATWVVRIPGATDAPLNADVDLNHVDDIVLEIKHEAVPLGSATSNPYHPHCP